MSVMFSKSAEKRRLDDAHRHDEEVIGSLCRYENKWTALSWSGIFVSTITTWALSHDNFESADDLIFFLLSFHPRSNSIRFRPCIFLLWSLHQFSLIMMDVSIFLLTYSVMETFFLDWPKWISQCWILFNMDFINLALEIVLLKNPWKLGLMRSVLGGK